MTPSQSIMWSNGQPLEIFDKNGRKLSVRRLTALDTLRLFKAAGPVLAQNEPWLAMAGLAFSVLEIDGIPVPTPVTEAQIETMIERLGEVGLEAVADTIRDDDETVNLKQAVGNLPGTPS
jgi:hypothetical protein